MKGVIGCMVFEGVQMFCVVQGTEYTEGMKMDIQNSVVDVIHVCRMLQYVKNSRYWILPLDRYSHKTTKEFTIPIIVIVQDSNVFSQHYYLLCSSTDYPLSQGKDE